MFLKKQITTNRSFVSSIKIINFFRKRVQYFIVRMLLLNNFVNEVVTMKTIYIYQTYNSFFN